ncbi:hypothetical protein WOLCODRAFT_150399 [Wolfiporia cocos MD-104 SS10]|uniref:Uncharacterized protein n=1 Tax=Wolfiporia cocos (strain MD-104) TaxID=742152 RepID=A0A2H3JNH6_WOLCO|nr:hypothetical protein WOLCODRAFT_150399 [Wolfiporia cocos MD-104 SS10]
MPAIVQTALNLTDSEVMQYALQVWVPSSYEGPQDKSQLLTVWLAYIPTNEVNNLAAQIKVQSSAFYTALSYPWDELAKQVDPSFAVDSVSSPGSTSSSGGNSSSNNNDATSSGNSNASKTREDAIIGVVSSLGAIALIVLAFLAIRAVKQRKELAHRRLAEPAGNEYDGSRPEGQEFDRDSVGGQRRRSFYYAADSLRGFEEVANAAAATYDSHMSPEGGMRERRPIAPGMIGTPILRDNTMNW